MGWVSHSYPQAAQPPGQREPTGRELAVVFQVPTVVPGTASPLTWASVSPPLQAHFQHRNNAGLGEGVVGGAVGTNPGLNTPGGGCLRFGPDEWQGGPGRKS